MVGNVGGFKKRMRHGSQHKKCNEQAHPAIGHKSACQHHGQNGMAWPHFFGHEGRDGPHRTTVVHQLAKQRTQQKDREKLGQKPRRRRHEGLGPMRQHRLARDTCRHQSRGRREQQNAPSAVGHTNQQGQREKNTKQTHQHRSGSFQQCVKVKR